MLNTKEWYELLEKFEKVASGRFDKESQDLWPKNVYQDGNVNNQFIIFLQGYSYGKSVGILEGLST